MLSLVLASVLLGCCVGRFCSGRGRRRRSRHARLIDNAAALGSRLPTFAALAEANVAAGGGGAEGG